MRLWKRVLLGVLLIAVVVVAFALSGVGSGLALLAYVLFVAALLITWALARLRAVMPPAPDFERRVRAGRPDETKVEQLETVRRLVILAGSSRSDLLRLRPFVREIAAARLSRRHGIDIERDADRAEVLLAGTRIGELLRPDPVWAADRRGPGWSRGELEQLVDELENL